MASSRGQLRWNTVLAVAFLVVLSALWAGSRAEAAFVPGEVVVGFEATGTETPPLEKAARLEERPEVDDARPVTGIGSAVVISLEADEPVGRAARRIAGLPGVAFAEPNFIYRISGMPNDPLFNELWGLRNSGQNVQNPLAPPLFGVSGIDSGAGRAWGISSGSGRSAVAVVDTGIAADHPDLSPRLDRKLSRGFEDGKAISGRAAWDDPHGHGTHVAGIIGAAGNNGIGVTGVNWRSKLVALRVCDVRGECASTDIAAAFAYAGRKGIPVLNASLGSDPGEPMEKSHLVERAMRQNPRTLYVTAAGNEHVNVGRKKVYPCASKLANLLCVTSIGPQGDLSYFANWNRKMVDLGAPGQYITGTWIDKRYPIDDAFLGSVPDWQQEPYPW
ncbi:MAG: S8 family serine peptidase, partial [Vibrio fluvialis]